MEELEEIFQSVEFENDGWIKLIRLERLDNILLLNLEINTGNEEQNHEHWGIRCVKPNDFHIENEVAYDIEVVHDHVLLWKYDQPEMSLFVNGRVENYRQVIGALYEKHVELTGGWYDFGEFFNETSRVLSGGFGLLACGPSPLMQAYVNVLEKEGIITSTLEHGLPKYYEQGWHAYNDKLCVLVLGDSYVVAQDFVATRT